MSRWRSLAQVAATVSLVVAASLGSYRVASAVPGGETRGFLTWSGRLTGRTGPTSLRFDFRRGAIAHCSVDVSATPDAVGRLDVEVPLAGCRGLFDGDDVRYDVVVGGAPLVRDQAVDPAPHARYADRVGVSDCPAGYEREPAGAVVLCRRALRAGAFDELVRVGDGEAAFWIDRFEASVWESSDASGLRFGAGSDDYPASFPDDGQWVAAAYARSVPGAGPSRFLTWFQAQEACRASGKRLPTMQEWYLAARGTVDPTNSDGSSGTCRTTGGSPRAGNEAGDSVNCESAWGAREMTGNVAEMVEEWFAQVGDVTTAANRSWPAAFGGDSTVNFAGTLIIDGAGTTGTGLPAMALRGGDATHGGAAGVLCLDVTRAPTYSGALAGFRCVVPR